MTDLSGLWVWLATVTGALVGCALLEGVSATWRLRREWLEELPPHTPIGAPGFASKKEEER